MCTTTNKWLTHLFQKFAKDAMPRISLYATHALVEAKLNKLKAIWWYYLCDPNLLYSEYSLGRMALLLVKWSTIMISSNRFRDIEFEIVSLPLFLFQFILWFGNFTIPMYKIIQATFLISSISMFCTFLTLEVKFRHSLDSLVWSKIRSKRSSVKNNWRTLWALRILREYLLVYWAVAFHHHDQQSHLGLSK